MIKCDDMYSIVLHAISASDRRKNGNVDDCCKAHPEYQLISKMNYGCQFQKFLKCESIDVCYESDCLIRTAESLQSRHHIFRVQFHYNTHIHGSFGVADAKKRYIQKVRFCNNLCRW